jgi:hypothetical protein
MCYLLYVYVIIYVYVIYIISPDPFKINTPLTYTLNHPITGRAIASMPEDFLLLTRLVGLLRGLTAELDASCPILQVRACMHLLYAASASCVSLYASAYPSFSSNSSSPYSSASLGAVRACAGGGARVIGSGE